MQASPAALQVYRLQLSETIKGQLPLPSQFAACISVYPPPVIVHESDRQDAVVSTQPPPVDLQAPPTVALHPVPPEQSVSVPPLTSLHVPLRPGRSHAWHAAPHALLQHTPSTQ